MSGFVNLALHRPANQSSICEFSIGATTVEDAGHGNDGSITGGATLHTGIDHPPWWMVDLQAVCQIHRITLFNRRGLESRLLHFSFWRSNDAVTWEVMARKQDDSEFGGADGFPFEQIIDPPVSARFVQLRAEDAPFLHFEECQIFGLPAPVRVEATAGDPPVLAGQALPEFAVATDVGSFGFNRRHERLEIFAAAAPPPQVPLRSSVKPHDVVVEEHYGYPMPPAVNVYAVHGAMLLERGLVALDGGLVMLRDCIPGYFLGHVAPGADNFNSAVLQPARWPQVQRLVCDRPVACPIHPNPVYGHFLLEMLPRLYVLSLLKQYGAQFTVAVPEETPDFIKAFVRLYFEEADLLWYRFEDQVIEAPSVLMASMLHSNYNLHPAFNLLIADLRARVGLPPQPRGPRAPAPGRRRIYLSRRHVGHNKRLENEDEVEAVMRRLGFAIVHPQEMSIAEQIELFDNADAVASEYTSALHNTLFSRPGTRVITIDYFSWYQSMIGGLRQQPHCFVAPEDGNFRNWRLPQGADRRYRVDPATLQTEVLAMVPEAAAGLHAADLLVAELAEQRRAADLEEASRVPDPAATATDPVVAADAELSVATPAWQHLRGEPPEAPAHLPPKPGLWRRLLGQR